jgi:phage-related protein
MFDGTVECGVPDIPVTREEEWRIDIAQFGDGYAQRILDGINALNLKFSVTFENRPADVIKSMLSFLADQKGNSFQFKEPATGEMYDVWCDKWSVTWTVQRWDRSNPLLPLAYYYGTLSAEFVRAYGVTG